MTRVPPELVKSAGLSEGILIVRLAQAHGKLRVPYQKQSTIGGAANLHFLACFDPLAQEYDYPPRNSEVLSATSRC